MVSSAGVMSAVERRAAAGGFALDGAGPVLPELVRRRVVLLATSNYAPEELLADPLRHHLVEPVIALLRAHLHVLEVDDGTDHRAARPTEVGREQVGVEHHHAPPVEQVPDRGHHPTAPTVPDESDVQPTEELVQVDPEHLALGQIGHGGVDQPGLASPHPAPEVGPAHLVSSRPATAEQRRKDRQHSLLRAVERESPCGSTPLDCCHDVCRRYPRTSPHVAKLARETGRHRPDALPVAGLTGQTPGLRTGAASRSAGQCRPGRAGP